MTMRRYLFILFVFSCFGLQAQLVTSFIKHVVTSGGSTPTWTNLVSHLAMVDGILADLHGSDNGTAYGAVNSGDTCFYFDGGDSVSIGGAVLLEGTLVMEAFPTDAISQDLWGGGGDDALAWYIYNDVFRQRVVSTGGGGTSVPSTDVSLIEDQWNFISIVFSASGDSVRYGANGVYETETDWTDTPTNKTTSIGKNTYGGVGGFVGYIRKCWYFNDLKSDSYLTGMYNSGNPIDYADGDPE